MDISVIIATHDRAALLRSALQSVVDQTLEDDAYEIIVVDNASRDQSKEVVTATPWGREVRYMYEDTPGLSRARNIGWRAATGRIVAFLDDDAVAEPQWLAELLRAFADIGAGPACVGGRVTLRFPAPAPHWLAKELYFCLSGLDCGPDPRSLNNSPYFLHGCNMAFPRTTLEDLGGFDPSLGRVGTSLRSAGEILLQERIREHGGTLYYHPHASVVHRVAPDRLRRRWFLRRLYAEGYSLARIEKIREGRAQHSCPRRALKQVWPLLTNLSFLYTRDPAQRFFKLTQLCRHLGMIRSFLLPVKDADRRSGNA